MKIRLIAPLALIMCAPGLLAAQEPDQPKITMDEAQWIAFYDLPSRRFREIRIAFVAGKFDQASSDLDTSANYLAVEALQAAPAIAERLQEVADQLFWTAENVSDVDITVRDLDAMFARAHWLLAQHYLHKARVSRDQKHHRNAGLYLWAMTHHLERAVLWSDSRIDRAVKNTLQDLRGLADRLQRRDRVEQAYSDRPMLKAEKLLQKLGAVIDRPVILPSENLDN